MKHWKRLAFYLLLNILVSACVTLTVLVIWDRTRAPIPGGVLDPVARRLLGDETPAPGADGPDAKASPQPTPTQVFIAYQVQQGDTFDSIGQMYGLSAEALMADNGFTSKTLGVGEVIRIPVQSQQEAAEVVIDNVIGMGDINSERVVIKQNGEGELFLAGWRLEDDNGNVFTFPQVTLFKGGAVNVFTKAGANTVVDLHWGLERALWEPGEAVTLRDEQGEVRASYSIP